MNLRTIAFLLLLLGGAQALAAGRPEITHGVASGDVADGQAVIWSRCDRPARMVVEVSVDGGDTVSHLGPAALAHQDFTAKYVLRDLPAGAEVAYAVSFQSLEDPELSSEPARGSFRTPPAESRNITFAWSGDTAGQGWGIDPARGGMKIYAAIRELAPQFFIHSGDMIYADNPLAAEVKLADGSTWSNLTTPAKSKVAETLDEFRGNFRYNLLDGHLREFNAAVPLYVQWDDHETTNNWFPGEQLVLDDRYSVKSAALLAARARQAFFDYNPIMGNARDPQRIYRHFRYGPDLEIFLVDLRSYRGENSENRQAAGQPGAVLFGEDQRAWLEGALTNSEATWKIVASDMPIGLVVGDGKHHEGIANGDPGGPAGRETEIASLLAALKAAGTRNVVWLTADVHYAASHHYHPDRASFGDFDPFWEFVSGPLHAGNFGPNQLDPTFGPEVKFSSAKKGNAVNQAPGKDNQFFGLVEFDAGSKALTISQRNQAGEVVFQVTLPPSAGGG